MTGAGQVGHPKGGKSFKHLALILASCFLLAPSLFGQTRFGQTRGGYPLSSVSSMGAYPRPSVSSMGAFGYGYGSHHHPAYSNGSYRGYGHSRGGWGYALPYYYIPLGDYGYGYDYDYVGGPDMYSGPPNMYSGPPPGANESTLHIIVEQPPAQSYRPPVDDTRAEVAPPPPTVHEQPSAARDAKPREPTVLVFRDGHQKEVGNYAIMGQTVYVLDERTQKISLADLDVPATVKANDDRGVEFKVPAVPPPAQKKSSDLQPNGTPDQNPPPAANVASVLP